MEKFAQRLKHCREQKKLSNPNWTQKYVADKIGMARTTYTAYENGTKLPPLDIVDHLATLLGVTTDYLLGRTDEKESKMNIQVAGKEINLSPEEFEVVKEIRKHPNLFHNLASNPEKQVKELIKLYTMKKMFLEDDDEDPGDGFGSIKD